MDYNLKRQKTLAALLFICKNSPDGECDMYSLLKILYFAEKAHLLKYGRTITGDAIIAMKYGPVMSLAFDMLKPSKFDPNYFDVQDNAVEALKEPDMSYLSESDVACLKASFEENKDLGFTKLKNKSHDGSYNEAWNKAKNSTISYLDVARHAGANEEFLKYIANTIENETLILNGDFW